MASDSEAIEETSFLENSQKEKQEPGTTTIRRRMQIKNDNGEHSLNVIVVLEDLRVCYYVVFLLIVIVGVILTKTFTKEDYNALLVQVYGISNTCAYFDYPPSTYIIPALWCVAVVLGFLYSSASILRIYIAYLERKLSGVACVLLILSHVHVVLSIMYFMISFAVQPEPKRPVTMLMHTAPYINLKISYVTLQAAIVHFGVKVSWLGFPRWFNLASIIHLVILIPVKVFGTLLIINALADMGPEMEGKGLWWDIRSDFNKIFAMIFTNVFGLLMGVLFPLLQAIYLSRKGADSHALILNVADNRPSAYAVSNEQL